MGYMENIIIGLCVAGFVLLVCKGVKRLCKKYLKLYKKYHDIQESKVMKWLKNDGIFAAGVLFGTVGIKVLSSNVQLQCFGREKAC